MCAYVQPFPPARIVSDNVYDGLIDAVGNTPLIKLQRASQLTSCNMYGKAELLEPFHHFAIPIVRSVRRIGEGACRTVPHHTRGGNRTTDSW
ncbi:Cysteine synthase [Gracilariopsis chorda]|uniref:Cysteine synthase n=1 Tax=Gracilariopsis chorda TaxID=448386 RepID=A0A2V3J5Z1_9FLOR|nr:Cysteine synthase [Gracilariopsis chorda]|eukprot:PXF49841.1 Cysteine synthase [Gracilariopsis chorda]